MDTIMLFTAPPLGEPELAALARLDELRASLRYTLAEPRRWYGSLRRLTFARNAQGSNSIEGFDAPLDDAAAVIDNEAPLDAATETTRALLGYRSAMTYVLQLCDDDEPIDFSTQLIKSLQYMMVGYDLANRPGRWRRGDIYVRDDAAQRVVYTGPDVDLVPALMDQLATSLNQPADTPPVISAALAHLNLVMIHPFRDGNGRIARCLQSLVLGQGRTLQGDGSLSPVFLSIEEYLGRNTQTYYNTLAAVGSDRWQPERDTRPWLRFILTAHLRQASTYRQRLRDHERLWQDLGDLVGPDSRVLPALADAALGFRVTRGRYIASLTASGEDVSEQTAGRDLANLAAAGHLVARGQKRGRYYIASDPIRQTWDRIKADRPTRIDTDPFADPTATPASP
jgi:Fic family protein